jgi:hypothetical protein
MGGFWGIWYVFLRRAFDSWRGVHMKQAVWHNLYNAAISESNPVKLRMRILEAESAIIQRIQTLDPDQDPEREVIRNALSSLHALQRNLLRYPSRQIV